MNEIIDPATISVLVQAAGLAIIAGLQKNADMKRDDAQRKTDEKRAAEAAWRESVEKKLADQDEKLRAVLKGQCTQMRSDIIHKAHRYIDDLGCASIEEKDAFDAEYKDYCAICEAHGIENNFVDNLAAQVMMLPSRDVPTGASSI